MVRCVATHSGLIVIDVQNDYFPGGAMPLVDMTAVAAQCRRLVDRFRVAGGLVVHVQHVAAEPGASLFAPATYGAAIHASVAPESGEAVIIKHRPNAFRGTALSDVLRRTGIRDLVVCGATTHACVDSTVRAAVDLGLACVVTADACATLDLELQGRIVKAADVQTAFLAALRTSFARVVRAADILATA